jgi:hypothetical protein
MNPRIKNSTLIIRSGPSGSQCPSGPKWRSKMHILCEITLYFTGFQWKPLTPLKGKHIVQDQLKRELPKWVLPNILMQFPWLLWTPPPPHNNVLLSVLWSTALWKKSIHENPEKEWEKSYLYHFTKMIPPRVYLKEKGSWFFNVFSKFSSKCLAF